MRYAIFAMLLALPGCTAFRVCPAVPAPPVVSPMPELCYPTLRPQVDSVDVLLNCLIEDVVKLEKAATEREAALQPYRQ